MARLLLIIFLAFLPACNLEPPYKRPCMPMPCSWRVEADKETTFVNMRWWESLGDPVLNELIETALHQNKDLQVAIYRVCEFFARYTVARAPLLPQINLDATAVKERIPPAESLTGKGVITPFYTYMFTLSYELDFWGLVQSQAHAACAQALAAIQNRRTVVLTLVTAVASAYIQLRELDRELKISFDTLEDRKEFLRLATIRYEGGLTSEIEVTQAAALYEEALAEITFLEQAIPQQENLISVLIGLPSTNIVRGREIDAFCFPPVIPAGLPAELLIRRPDILAAEFQLIAANAEIGAARAAFFPQINLIALFGGESFKFSTLFSGKNRIWEFGTSIMQPIFTGGQLTGELNIAVAQKQEALYTYEQTILTAISEVNNALIALRQTQELVRVQEGNVAANKEYLRLSWLQYYEGQTDYLTVLDAETRLFDAQIQLTQAQGGVFIALVEVYKALGGGWVIDADCVLRKE